MNENNQPQHLTAEESARAKAIFDEKIVPTMQELTTLCQANKIAFVFACRFATDEKIDNALNAANLEDQALPPGEMFAAQICIESRGPIEAMMQLASQFTPNSVKMVKLSELPADEQAKVRKDLGLPAEDEKVTIQ